MKAPILSVASVLCPHCQADLFPGRLSNRNRRTFAQRLICRASDLVQLAMSIEPKPASPSSQETLRD